MVKIEDGNVEPYVRRLFSEEFADSLKKNCRRNGAVSLKRDISDQSLQLKEADDE